MKFFKFKKYLKRSALPLCLLAVVGLFLTGYFIKPFDGGGIPCYTYSKLGIKCLSCGATRALYCLSVGDVLGAFKYNSVFAIGLPVGIIFCALKCINLTFDRQVVKLPAFRNVYVVVGVAVCVIFVIIRNVV